MPDLPDGDRCEGQVSTSQPVQPALTFDIYHSEVDGVTVVHVCTDQLPEDAKGPIIRIYLNDEPVFENPALPEANESPAGNDEKSHWDDDPEFPISDWQHEVVEGNTRLGYHQWMANQREQ